MFKMATSYCKFISLKLPSTACTYSLQVDSYVYIKRISVKTSGAGKCNHLLAVPVRSSATTTMTREYLGCSGEFDSWKSEEFLT